VRGGAPEHGDAPEHDRHRQRPGPVDPVGQHAEGEGGDGSHQRTDPDKEPDVEVVDVEMAAELNGRGAHRGGVGAAQGQYAGQYDDDGGPGGSAQCDGQPRPGRTTAEAGGTGEAAAQVSRQG